MTLKQCLARAVSKKEIADATKFVDNYFHGDHGLSRKFLEKQKKLMIPEAIQRRRINLYNREAV